MGQLRLVAFLPRITRIYSGERAPSRVLVKASRFHELFCFHPSSSRHAVALAKADHSISHLPTSISHPPETGYVRGVDLCRLDGAEARGVVEATLKA